MPLVLVAFSYGGIGGGGARSAVPLVAFAMYCSR
jgi:hypothetical protein